MIRLLCSMALGWFLHGLFPGGFLAKAVLALRASCARCPRVAAVATLRPLGHTGVTAFQHTALAAPE